MSLNYSLAAVTLVGISPYSQSRQHDDPLLEGETRDAYDARTWRSKLSTRTANNDTHVVIPAHGVHQAIIAAAKYSKRQIPGQGKATWTKKFEAGIALLDDPPLLSGGRMLTAQDAQCVTISANADGIRGSGKRVTRRFPVFSAWETTFDVHILDLIITEDVFREMLALAGMFIGLGRFRPEKGGTNGRFRLEKLEWADGRKLVA